MTVSQSGRSAYSRFRPMKTSEKGFGAKRFLTAGETTLPILKLVRLPATAMASIVTPNFHGSCFHVENRNDPDDVPTTIATNVLISSKIGRASCRERG